MSVPDKKGHFGIYGGKFAPETLMPALDELEQAYLAARKDKGFQAELAYYFREFIGRPTPLYLAQRLTDQRSAVERKVGRWQTSSRSYRFRVS